MLQSNVPKFNHVYTSVSMFDIGQFDTYSNALIKFTELEITDMI